MDNTAEEENFYMTLRALMVRASWCTDTSNSLQTVSLSPKHCRIMVASCIAAWWPAGAGSFKSWQHFYRSSESFFLRGMWRPLSASIHMGTNHTVEWLEDLNSSCYLCLLRWPDSKCFRKISTFWRDLRWISVQASAARLPVCSRRKRSFAVI